MRVIKLGLEALPTMGAVDALFESLENDLFPAMGMITDGAVKPGESLVFLHGGRVVRKARSASILRDDDTIQLDGVDRPRRMIRISEFQDLLFRAAGVAVNIATVKWNHIREDANVEALWERL